MYGHCLMCTINNAYSDFVEDAEDIVSDTVVRLYGICTLDRTRSDSQRCKASCSLRIYSVETVLWKLSLCNMAHILRCLLDKILSKCFLTEYMYNSLRTSIVEDIKAKAEDVFVVDCTLLTSLFSLTSSLFFSFRACHGRQRQVAFMLPRFFLSTFRCMNYMCGI